MQDPKAKLSALLAGAVACVCALSFALATPAAATSIEELEQRVGEAGKTYEDAMAKVEALEASAAENQQKISAIEAQIPDQKAKSADAVRRLYKLEQNRNGLIELILSSDDFNSFISMVNYMAAIQEANADEANRLVELKAELQRTQQTIEAQKAEAEEQRKIADDALEEAEKARDEAIAEARRKAAEEAARAAAKTAAQQAVVTGDTAALDDAIQSTKPQNQPPATNPEPQAPEAPVAPAEPAPEAGEGDREAFISEWTQRIDAYLAGSPLAGYGYAFAEAACDYGVDPRWSPAISNTESSKGAVCFLPHNAWGWGQASWPDWDTAIRAHVRGLAQGYGYTISQAAAQKYCPPTWQDWYIATASEMAKI